MGLYKRYVLKKLFYPKIISLCKFVNLHFHKNLIYQDVLIFEIYIMSQDKIMYGVLHDSKMTSTPEKQHYH